MNPNTELVDGVLVVDCGYNPPTEEWTNNYQDMGGDEYWGEGGKVYQVLESRGLSGNLKPLFALGAESGAPYTLLQLDAKFYFFSADDETLERIDYPNNLGEILGTIGDPDGGLGEISMTTV
ncbi:hypothetical protein FPCIR_2934 [Fusarium pseudocircinatum]|uniref:Uncharacterized protein n=1 Tax=Fusarium pseudocircinatum TaxID=56676 RepID=A0A8H5UTJ3_9HYPO|nr:hypothetical protein FPCIR_2934 [Fusarium pseudocircinatum]